MLVHLMRSVSRTSNTRQSHIPKKTIPRTSKLAKKPPQSKLAEGRAKQTQGKQQSGLLKLGPPGTGKCKGDTSARKIFRKFRAQWQRSATEVGPDGKLVSWLAEKVHGEPWGIGCVFCSWLASRPTRLHSTKYCRQATKWAALIWLSLCLRIPNFFIRGWPGG